MPVARVATGLLKHFNQVLETWGGVELTHIIITEIIDDFGQIIDRSQTETIIYGLVGNPDFKGSNQPLGFFQPGDLCLTCKYTDDVIISNKLTETSTRHDHIIYKGIEYRVEDMEIGYDVLISSISTEPVICKYLLRRVII